MSDDWIIIGAQTGTDARQPEKEWVEEILDAFDGPVFLKDNLKWSEKRQEFPENSVYISAGHVVIWEWFNKASYF